jgi:phosphatidylglycerophosphatase C
MDVSTKSVQLAVFDLDGTLTWHDTLLPFLAGFWLRHPLRWVHGWRLAPALCAFVLTRDRGKLKSRVIRSVMGGADRASIEAWSEHFVDALVLRRGLRPQALAALEAHRAAGDRLVLLSASPDLYVPRIAHRLGFEKTLCTEVAWHAGRLDGGLLTPNRRGAEKCRCLEALRREFPGVPIVAYGNSGSDLPHLGDADRALLVNADAAARRAADRAGIPVADWH